MRQAADLIARFTQERDQFLQKLEREAVELSLAVAARILRREPRWIRSCKLVRPGCPGSIVWDDRGAAARAAGELSCGIEAMAAVPQPCREPAVVAGDGMRLGDCVMRPALVRWMWGFGPIGRD